MLRNLVKVFVAVFAFVLLPIVWLAQLALFVPFLFVSCCFKKRVPPSYERAPVTTCYQPEAFCFDRLRDASKVYGCNTRNVKYRWSLFVEAIESVKQRIGDSRIPLALDFGAGSLRDTYELSCYGFQVTALDLDKVSMNEGSRFYDWTSVRHSPVLRSGSLNDLDGNCKFDVITAFDVIEHLYSPEDVLHTLQGHLDRDGVLLITVPNRRALWEQVRRLTYERHKRQGRLDRTTGRPHVQFRTPKEWAAFFRKQGFIIRRHEMTIGFLVNDLWAGIYSISSVVFIEPVLISLLKRLGRFGFNYRNFSLGEVFYPHWLMQPVSCLDLYLKPLLHHRWGWNLFVLSKS